MHITFDTKTLRDAVQKAATVAAGTKSGLPICTYLCFQATETAIRLYATDLETSLALTAHGEIHESGNCTVQANRLLAILNHVDGTQFTLKANADDDDTRDDITLTAENATFRLTGLPAAEFPRFTTCDAEAVDMPAPRFLAALRQALISAGGQFEGVFVVLFPKYLECMATDAMQMTCIAAPNDIPDILHERDVFIPQRSAAVVLNTFKDAETLTVRMALENSLCAITDTAETELTLRLGSAALPNHRKLLDSEQTGSVTIERERLLATIKRIIHFTNPANNACVLQATEGDGHQLHLSAITPELGEAYETVATLSEPTPIRLGLNARVLLKALHAAETEKVTLTYSETLKPFIIKSETAHEHITLIMPIRLESR